MHVLHVVGARPNFMKVAPVIMALARRDGVRQTLIHTGQHYDRTLSDVFFDQLEIPRPNVCLGVGSGSHAAQTAGVMLKLDLVLDAQRPDMVLVYGDVNSTLAAALVCAKRGIHCGHVEAGLRSFDATMPEEINRAVTDRISDVLFTPSADADDNLHREGIPPDRIHRVGNVMIDTLVRCRSLARMPDAPELPGEFVLVTLHRPANVDRPATLRSIVSTLMELSCDCPIVFPVHPRTRRQLERFACGLGHRDRVMLLEPVGYVQMIALQQAARMVITDSGGLQEETTYLGVPCLTLRESTERPITVQLGSNVLVGADMPRLKTEFRKILDGKAKQATIPPLWDGRASERITEALFCESAADDNQSPQAA